MQYMYGIANLHQIDRAEGVALMVIDQLENAWPQPPPGFGGYSCRPDCTTNSHNPIFF